MFVVYLASVCAHAHSYTCKCERFIVESTRFIDTSKFISVFVFDICSVCEWGCDRRPVHSDDRLDESLQSRRCLSRPDRATAGEWHTGPVCRAKDHGQIHLSWLRYAFFQFILSFLFYNAICSVSIKRDKYNWIWPNPICAVCLTQHKPIIFYSFNR